MLLVSLRDPLCCANGVRPGADRGGRSAGGAAYAPDEPGEAALTGANGAFAHHANLWH